MSTDNLITKRLKWKNRYKYTCEVGGNLTQSSLVCVSIEEVGEVVFAVFCKAEVLNSERDILPLLYSRPALRSFQGQVLNLKIGQQGNLLVLHLISPVL